MSKFAIGEVAVIYCPFNPCHGQDVEITSSLIPEGSIIWRGRPAEGRVTDNGYKVLIGGVSGWAREKDLRKKRPPQKLGSWDRVEKLTGWHPQIIHIDN